MAKIATVTKIGTQNEEAPAETQEPTKVNEGEAPVEPVVPTQAPSQAPSVEITIDDDIPMPETARAGGKPKYPWATLNEGQSFFVANAKVETFYTLCTTASKKHGHKFIARRWEEKGGVKGVRVWRSKD